MERLVFPSTPKKLRWVLFFYLIVFKNIRNISFRPCGNGNDNLTHPYCNVWLNSRKCTQGVILILSWYMDGHMHHFRVCFDNRIYNCAQFLPKQSKEKRRFYWTDDAYSNTCCVYSIQCFILVSVVHVLHWINLVIKYSKTNSQYS